LKYNEEINKENRDNHRERERGDGLTQKRPRPVSGSARAVIGTVKGGAVSGARVPMSGVRGGGYARERRRGF
jgi:hypothetical protein